MPSFSVTDNAKIYLPDSLHDIRITYDSSRTQKDNIKLTITSDKYLQKDENSFFLLITLKCYSDPTDTDLPNTYGGTTASYNPFVINLIEYCTHRFYYDGDSQFKLEYLSEGQTILFPSLVSGIEGCVATTDLVVVRRTWSGSTLEGYLIETDTAYMYEVSSDAPAGSYVVTVVTTVEGKKTYKTEVNIEIVNCETTQLSVVGALEFTYSDLTAASLPLLTATSD